MSNSLADQLLKAGLIDAKQAKSAEKSKHKADVNKRKGKKKKARQAEPSAESLRAQEAQRAKAARDRELNAAREAEAKRKELEAQVRQLVEQHRVQLPDADKEETVGYHFTHNNKVKKIWVSPQQRDQLGRGALAIVRYNPSYALIPAEVVPRVAERLPKAVLFHHVEPEEKAEDDPYAGYEVPDDLMW
ncbi:MAG: DUF2058 domain-containing protein [Gammaproteobacteria bacterium]